MVRTHKIDVDCACCAEEMERAAQATPGVVGATVDFMALRMIVEIDDGQDVDAVMRAVREACRRVGPDCDVFL